MKGGKTPTVVDATAGLGRDAFLLASLGATVTLIEREPQLQQLLSDALIYAQDAGGEVAEIVSRMTLLCGDAKDLLPSLSADVILVDPMHPERKKSALVKNEMRLIRQIVGDNSDAGALMHIALATAQKRVVLKWPLRADPLPGIPAPSHKITSKTLRYDVFMIAS
jgi:16S rRNA (guanine1516-N2)-methyltransferase